jgi:two-component system sensor histidine kinase NreB
MLTDTLLRDVFDASPDAILVVDGGGVIRDANEPAATMFQWDRGELVGLSVDLLVPFQHRARHAELRAEYALQPRARPMGHGLLLHGERRDGVQFPVEIALTPWQPAGDEPMVVCTVRDLSRFDRWRSMSMAREEAAEAERTRMAAELHDDIVQRMVFIKHRFTTLRDTQGLSGDDDRLLELSSAIDDTIASIERICRGLTPLELKHFGLSFALRILFREHSEAGFAVQGDLMDVGRELDPAKALSLFRIVQESLSNAREHSGADEAVVTLTRDPEWIEVEVRDAGVGFDTAAVASSGSGIGLLGMSERAAMVGGLFEVRSSLGSGTGIRVRVPVDEHATAVEEL